MRKVSLQKESLSRGLSLPLEDQPIDSNAEPSELPTQFSGPDTPACNHSFASGATSPYGACEWDADDEEDGWAALTVENRKLKAELRATQYVAATEMKKRAALEKEVERLRRLVPESEEMVNGEELLEEQSVRSHLGNGELEAANDRGEVALMALKEQLSTLRHNNPGFQTMWGASNTGFKVRGRTYMSDGLKVEARDPLFELIHMEILDVETGSKLPRADHVVEMLKTVSIGLLSQSSIYRHDDLTSNDVSVICVQVDGVYTRCRQSSRPPYLLVVNFQVPGLPCCSVVVYFALNNTYRTILEREMEALQDPQRLSDLRLSDVGTGGEEDDLHKVLRLLARFIVSDDEYRNARFKLIPSMVEGPWVVKTAVGNKPVILGRKLTQRYSSGPGYLEIDIDIGSSSIASRVLALVRDYSRNIVVDVAVLIQVSSRIVCVCTDGPMDCTLNYGMHHVFPPTTG